jgi:hypothetical protein
MLKVKYNTMSFSFYHNSVGLLMIYKSNYAIQMKYWEVQASLSIFHSLGKGHDVLFLPNLTSPQAFSLSYSTSWEP